MPDRWLPSWCLHSRPAGRTRKERRTEKRRERISCSCGPREQGPLGREAARYGQRSGPQDSAREAGGPACEAADNASLRNAFKDSVSAGGIRSEMSPKEAVCAGDDGSAHHRPSEEKRSENSRAQRRSRV